MSRIKEFYHEEITRGQAFGDVEDADYAYMEWKQAQEKQAVEDEELIAWVEAEAEKAEFFRVFEASGCYPM